MIVVIKLNFTGNLLTVDFVLLDEGQSVEVFFTIGLSEILGTCREKGKKLILKYSKLLERQSSCTITHLHSHAEGRGCDRAIRCLLQFQCLDVLGFTGHIGIKLWVRGKKINAGTTT